MCGPCRGLAVPILTIFLPRLIPTLHPVRCPALRLGRSFSAPTHASRGQPSTGGMLKPRISRSFVPGRRAIRDLSFVAGSSLMRWC
ncbi:hypothetical protein C8R47DRAFT_304929 [Mycena vitilis]|nr:hypothetical protein C8R47DRAFT_304929 [Mycena vitilis]